MTDVVLRGFLQGKVPAFFSVTLDVGVCDTRSDLRIS